MSSNEKLKFSIHGPTTRFIGIFSQKKYDLMASMQRGSVDEEISCGYNYFGQKKRSKKISFILQDLEQLNDIDSRCLRSVHDLPL